MNPDPGPSWCGPLLVELLTRGVADGVVPLLERASNPVASLTASYPSSGAFQAACSPSSPCSDCFSSRRRTTILIPPFAAAKRTE